MRGTAPEKRVPRPLRAGLPGVRKVRTGSDLFVRGVEAGRHQELGQLSLGSDELDLDGGEPFIAEPERVGGGVGQVDDAAFGDGTAVVHGNDNRFIITEIGDAQDGTEGQGSVGAGELILVVGGSAGGGFSLEELAIPGSYAELVPAMVADNDLGIQVFGR